MKIVGLFITIILVQLFYAISITALIEFAPPPSLNYITSFSDLADTINLDSVSDEFEQSIDNQLDIPVVEIGALVFHSGNILIDLLLNFFFAIPEMASLLLQGLSMLFAFNPIIIGLMQRFFYIAVIIMYVIGLIQLLTGVRSGRAIE